MSKEELLKELKHLLTRSHDAEKGLIIAKTEAKRPLLQAYFQEKIAHKYHYRHQLKELIEALGGETDSGPSPEGTIHRTWLDIKAFATGNDEEALLKEVERGEKVFLGAYDKVLAHADLPAHVKNLLERQRQSIKITLGDVQQLYRQ